MSLDNVYKQREEILKKKNEILADYLQTKNKSKTGRKFGISAGGVDSALAACGRKDLVSIWYRVRIMKDPTVKPEDIKKRVSKKTVQEEIVKVQEQTPVKPVTPTAEISTESIAREVLAQALEAMVKYDRIEPELIRLRDVENKYYSLLKEKGSWNAEYNKLNELLMKTREEKDRLLKIHNTIIIASKEEGKPLPSVDDVLAIIRRRMRPGDKL